MIQTSPETTRDDDEPSARGLQPRVASIGRDLGRSMSELIDAVPGGPHGTVELARRLSIDKVLSSRILKASRSRDPVAVAHLMPGPEPLRRVLRGAEKQKVDPEIIRRAHDAVSRFDQLIRIEAGDRSALDTILSAWLPGVRAQFETRRKQSAFKATSQIKGVMADTNLATVILHPAADGTHIDIVWVFGLLGLQRLRPGAPVKLATRRMTQDGVERHPLTLEGAPVESIRGLFLSEFCSDPPPSFEVATAGEVVHYTLGGEDFGPRSAVDFVMAENNPAEIDRYVPAEKHRRASVFSEISTPVKLLQFDVLVHDDIYPGSEPELLIYDTAFDGVADVNNPARNLDRLDLAESIQLLGRGLTRIASPDIPSYPDLMQHVFQRLGWSADPFRGYRCRVEYPIYGTQVTLAFQPPTPPA